MKQIYGNLRYDAILENGQQPNPSRRAWLQSVLATASSILAGPLQASATSKAACDSTVSVWQNGKRTIYLLGTAHISQVSAELAGRLVDDIHPNAVFVELDLKRVGGVLGSNPSDGLVIPDVVASSTPTPQLPSSTAASTATPATISSMAQQQTSSNWFQRQAMNFAAKAVGNALRGMYSNLGESGFKPGEEFAVAMQHGQDLGASIILGDQDVEYTLRRLTQALAVTDLEALTNPDAEFEKSMTELFGSTQVTIDSSKDNFKDELTDFVERLKSRENVRKVMGQLKEVAPALVQVMLTERDAYMARGLDTLNQFECIVAVMGIAHQDGVEANLREQGWKPLPLVCPAN